VTIRRRTRDPSPTAGGGRRLPLDRLFAEGAAGALVQPAAIAATLDRLGIVHVFIGGIVVGCYSGRPRATQDVDVVLAPGSDADAAARAIAGLGKRLTIQRFPSFIAIQRPASDGGASAVDLVTTSAGSYGLAFEAGETLRLEGQAIRIPSIEVMLVLKYTAAVNPIRPAERALQDWADLAAMAAGTPTLHRERAYRLGNAVVPGYGDDLERRLKQGDFSPRR
jgi:hypothetical protein